MSEDDDVDVADRAEQAADAQEIALELCEDLPPEMLRMIGWALIGMAHRAEGNDRLARHALFQGTCELLVGVDDLADAVEQATDDDG